MLVPRDRKYDRNRANHPAFHRTFLISDSHLSQRPTIFWTTITHVHVPYRGAWSARLRIIYTRLLKRAIFFHASVTHVRSSQQRVVFHVQADNLSFRASARTAMVVIGQSCSWKKSRWHGFRDNFTILRIDVISRSRGRKWASSSWTPCAPALMDVDLKIRSFSRAAAVRLWTSTLQATLVLLESFCQPRSTGYIKFFRAWILFGRIVLIDGSCIVLYRRQ